MSKASAGLPETAIFMFRFGAVVDGCGGLHKQERVEAGDVIAAGRAALAYAKERYPAADISLEGVSFDREHWRSASFRTAWTERAGSLSAEIGCLPKGVA